VSGYLWFNGTGVKEIDTILDELHNAGNSYHHTESWGETTDWQPRSHIDLIQEAANRAGEALAAIRAENERLRDLLRAAACPDRNCDGKGTTFTIEVHAECCQRGENGCDTRGCSGPFPMPERVPEPCRWCNERDAILSAPEARNSDDKPNDDAGGLR